MREDDVQQQLKLLERLETRFFRNSLLTLLGKFLCKCALGFNKFLNFVPPIREINLNF